MQRDGMLATATPEPIATYEIRGGRGLALHAREWGDRTGPAVLFIHGLSQCDACWTKQVEGPLADLFRLITVDLRGHGLSEKPPDAADYADGRLWADDIAAVIDQARLVRPVLVGWSYGGYVISDFLRAYGDAGIAAINLVGGAILLAPPAFDHIGAGLLENAPAMCGSDLLANIAATRRFLASCTAHDVGEDDAATMLGWNMVTPPAVRAALIAREIDGTDALADVTVPVLVTHGRDDAIVLPSMAERTLACCRQAVPSWYDAVGHMPFWEAPERFDRELAELTDRAQG